MTSMSTVARLGLLLAISLATLGAADARAATRELWIAADPVAWDVVPNGRNAIEGERYRPDETRLTTVAYRAYTPRWGRPLKRQGLIGPHIRIRVGDRLVVHFRNNDTHFDRHHSMHFHGVHYRFGSDGSHIPGFSGRGGNVPPGESYTYRFTAGADSRGVWSYHDHSTSMMESIAGGLYGAISVLGRHERRPDREFTVFFGAVGGFQTINGRAFVGNTPVFRAKVGEDVRWNVLTLGDEHHTFHVHGHRWRRPDRTPEDTRTIGPAESFSVRWREDRPGTWLYHCHVESHMMRGMVGIYRVTR